MLFSHKATPQKPQQRSLFLTVWELTYWEYLKCLARLSPNFFLLFSLFYKEQHCYNNNARLFQMLVQMRHTIMGWMGIDYMLVCDVSWPLVLFKVDLLLVNSYFYILWEWYMLWAFHYYEFYLHNVALGINICILNFLTGFHGTKIHNF